MIGRELEGYRIEAELGRGGQAVVYRATQLSLQRTVALKVVSPQLSSDANFKERFTREGIAAASLDHPHVIPVFEAGEADGLAFLAMKYVDGPSLDAVLHQPGGVEPRRVMAILRQVAEALDYMAERGLVHRDVKPANILLAPGDHAYLSDFGLIKALSAARLTSSGVWMGTLEYVAPEQIRGGDVTPAADRYALAALAFEALTGRTLFPREDRTATLFAHVNDEPPTASEFNPGLGTGVDSVLARGLSKKPEDRHPTAIAFIDALDAAIAAMPGAADAKPPRPAAVPPPPPPPPVASRAPAATVTGESPVPPPTPDGTGGGPAAPGPDRTRLAMIAGGGIAVIILIVVGVMFAGGSLGGGDKTTTTFVLDTTAGGTTPVTTGPSGDTLGAVLPAEVPGWSVIPTGPDLPNLTNPPGATVESAQFARGSEIALAGALRMADPGDTASAFAELSSAVEGQDLGDPALGPDAQTGWVRTVLDGTAVGFTTGDRVVLVLSARSEVALELARQLSGG
ncbi:MAG: serine/threonine-protein kinase [Thermoleophilia bacterium]|jgi:serine/threonine-protein kinase